MDDECINEDDCPYCAGTEEVEARIASGKTEYVSCPHPCHRLATPAPDSEKLREAHDGLVETADYLIDSYQRLWRGGVVRDLAEAEGAYQAAKDFMALTLGASL